MWLLDVNLPKKIVRLLSGFGITAESADDRGWGGLANGALAEAAQQAGFQCILRRDRLFSESAARALKRFRQFCDRAGNDSTTPRSRIPGGVPQRLGPQPNPTHSWTVVALARC